MPVTGNNQLQYNLSIRITADGFSFFVTEAFSGDLMHREDFAKREDETMSRTLSKMMVRPSITRHTYNNVRVVIDSDSTCIPIDEFSRENLQQYYKLIFDNVDIEANKVCYTVIPQIEVVEAFTVPKDICDTVLEFYPEATFTNSYAMVLTRTTQFCNNRAPSTRPLFAYVQNRQLFLFSIFQDKLLFANSFMVDQEQNALFYLLSVWKELGLDVYNNICFIGGDPEPTKKLTEEAKAYLQHVEMMETIDLAHL